MLCTCLPVQVCLISCPRFWYIVYWASRCIPALRLWVQRPMWINYDWRLVESGWCRVINQHNEGRWALCRWSSHSGLCHSAGGLFTPHQWPCFALTVFLGMHRLLSLWGAFCMILFENHQSKRCTLGFGGLDTSKAPVCRCRQILVYTCSVCVHTRLNVLSMT